MRKRESSVRGLVAAVAAAALILVLAPTDLDAKGKPVRKPNNGPPLIMDVLQPGTGGFGDAVTPSVDGIWNDGNPFYEDSIAAVQAYFGVTGKDVNLVTYNSGRTLHFVFDPSSAALAAAGLPSEFDAEVVMFGINYWGEFQDMAVGSTAQVQSDLEFKMRGATWELDYQSLAIIRTGEFTWTLTTAAADIGGWSPGFTPSDQAQLNSIKKQRHQAFGTVNMPLRINITLK